MAIKDNAEKTFSRVYLYILLFEDLGQGDLDI